MSCLFPKEVDLTQVRREFGSYIRKKNDDVEVGRKGSSP